MSYFIFTKNSDNIEGTIYKIAENQSDLNNLNINQTDYKIIEDSQSNFDLVKLGNKYIQKYNNNVISYVNETVLFTNKQELENFLNNFKDKIKKFTDNNTNHLLFNRWNNYYIQLNSFNLDSITYPLNKSLEQHFNDLGQPSYNILQLP
jgi:hypothetical protein